MNKVVFEHYPIEKLPQEMRAAFPAGTKVRLELTDEGRGQPTAERASDIVARLQSRNRGRGLTVEQAAAEVRSLRDEWDD